MTKWLFHAAMFVGKILLCGLIVLGYLYFSLPNVESLRHVGYQEPLEILTRDGELIESFGKVHRIPVKIEDIPTHQIQAVLVTEDQRFYEHPGIDLVGIGRALKSLLSTGEKRQGASTITMQVARNFFLGREKTYMRKINEVLLALAIERSISKDEILELYFNKIYFGHRAYGIAAAARNYFAKTLDEMTIAEMAMLAGLPKSPSRNNPIDNLPYATARRNLILKKMLDKGVIDEPTYESSCQEEVVLRTIDEVTELSDSGRYVADLARQTVVSTWGEQAYEMGLRVYTTIDSAKQIAAMRAVRLGLDTYDKKEGWQRLAQRENIAHLEPGSKAWNRALRRNHVGSQKIAAMVVDQGFGYVTVQREESEACDLVKIRDQCWLDREWCRQHGGKLHVNALALVAGDVVLVQEEEEQLRLTQIPRAQGALVALGSQTAEVEALVGGYAFSRSHFNRATQAYRQPGSAIKPLIYSAALDNGYTMATKVNDAPIVIEDMHGENDLWRPKNVDHQFKGPIRLRQALIQSRNLVSIRLADDLGVGLVTDYYERFGLDRTKQPQGLSISLGAGVVTPLQLAHAFTVFPNQGRLEPVKWIQRIETKAGEIFCDEETLRTAEHKMLPLETNEPREVVSPETAYMISSGLRDVIRYGTGRAANVMRRGDLHGKTGTSNDQADAWFSGFNPDLVTSVWVGHDDVGSQKLKGMGSKVALPIWVAFMGEALDKNERQLEAPDNIVRLRINRETGLPVTKDLSNSMFELFEKNNTPQVATVKNQSAQIDEEISWRDEIF